MNEIKRQLQTDERKRVTDIAGALTPGVAKAIDDWLETQPEDVNAADMIDGLTLCLASVLASMTVNVAKPDRLSAAAESALGNFCRAYRGSLVAMTELTAPSVVNGRDLQ